MSLTNRIKESKFGKAYDLTKNDIIEGREIVNSALDQPSGYRLIDWYSKYFMKEILVPLAEPIVIGAVYVHHLRKQKQKFRVS